MTLGAEGWGDARGECSGGEHNHRGDRHTRCCPCCPPSPAPFLSQSPVLTGTNPSQDGCTIHLHDVAELPELPSRPFHT